LTLPTSSSVLITIKTSPVNSREFLSNSMELG
jgi:hypothetical protein